jgi:hypothetical protein
MHEICRHTFVCICLRVIIWYGNMHLTIRTYTQDAPLLIKGKIGLRTQTHTPVAHCPDAATVRCGNVHISCSLTGPPDARTNNII